MVKDHTFLEDLEPESRYVALDFVDIVFSDTLVLGLALLLKLSTFFSDDDGDVGDNGGDDDSGNDKPL